MCSAPQHAAVFAAASCSCCPTTTTVPTESKLPPQRVNPYIFIDGWTPRATALDLEAGAEIPSTVVQYLAKTAAMGHGCRTAAARGVKDPWSRTTTMGRRAEWLRLLHLSSQPPQSALGRFAPDHRPQAPQRCLVGTMAPAGAAEVLGRTPKSTMACLCPLHLLLLLLTAAAAASASGADEAHVSVAVAEKGLAFAKDVLIGEAVRSLTPLRLPGVEKAVRVPFLGGVSVAASNITLFHLDVGDNSTIFPGDSGLLIVASGVTANISMHWSYCYDSWLFPIEITDSGTASILVQGMEVGITMVIKNNNGSLALSASQCGCYVKDLVISLDGGASWFYQGFINAFEDHIKAAVEKAIPENIIEGAGKLDSFLQGLPRTISLDDVAAFNMTFINDPHYGNSSIEFDINGLVTSAVAKTTNLQKHPQLSLACGGASKMLLLSLDEDVLNSALEVHFKAGSMHWVVDKVPDQSLLNTANWKFIIPRLYWNYPNDDMLLNISMASSPVIRITSEKIEATINADMVIDVVDGKETVPVACISVIVSASGVVDASGNKVYGRVGLDNFSLALKWSKIGNFHMSLIQGVIRVFLNTVCMPYLNSRLGNGFILPVVHGFTLQDVYVLTSAEQLTLCSDVTFNASSLASLSLM